MVRRSPALVLTSALIVSAFAMAMLPASAVQPAASAPGDTPETGNLYVSPESFSVGQSVKLTANFPSGLFTVTYFKKVSDSEWTSIGTDESNKYGNAYLNHVVNEPEEIYARITSGGPEGRTETKTLTPTPAGVIAPNGPDTGNLYQSPTTYAAGDEIKITANFPSGTFPITLYKEGPADTWTEVATKTSNKYGNAYFYDFSVTAASQRVFARKANNDRTEVDEIKPSPKLTLSIRRDCTGNDCDPTATAYGEFDPVDEGRTIKLQRRKSSSWVSVGSTAITGADGKAQIQFSLAGVPQWTTRTYRLTSAAAGSSPSVTSNQITFMPGPSQLGVNVLRVDVDKGVFPTTKGPEYTGAATLSVNGTTTFDHVPLQKFGVRGNSTAKYVKKPYKLKFLDKPPKGSTVFGMPRSKTWTLLANFKDNSHVRDKVGLELGRRMGHISWTPQSQYVEMFVNDQYRGAYLMTESVKIDGSRVDIDETHGMMMETDGESVDDPAVGFMSTIGEIVFAFKDPDDVKDGGADPTGVTPAKLTAIKDRINAFEAQLYDPSTRTQYPDYIDVDSAIDFHLVREFAKSADGAFWRSHYFSWDPSDPAGTSGNPLRDGRFHFGPVWDFDGSAGNGCTCGTSGPFANPPEGWIMRGTGSGASDRTYRTHWFVQLFKDPAFEAAVKARWAEVKGEFAKVSQTETAAYKAALGVGAANDRARWASEPKPRASRGTYEQEVAWVTGWYEDRYAWMDDQLSN